MSKRTDATPLSSEPDAAVPEPASTSPTYNLDFDDRALKEFKKLNAPIREQFKSKLDERLRNPRVERDRLSGMPNCYKIKLRSVGYRLVYEVEDDTVTVVVMSVGKRDKSAVYTVAKGRLRRGK